MKRSNHKAGTISWLSIVFCAVLLMAILIPGCSRAGGGETSTPHVDATPHEGMHTTASEMTPSTAETPATTAAKEGEETAETEETSTLAGESPVSPEPEKTGSDVKKIDVAMENFTFKPAELTIPKGTTVQWTNKDSAPHEVTSGKRGKPDGLFDSGDLSLGQSFSYTFEKTGNYPYYCEYHSSMDGKIIVK